ncbi:HD-GYP domain-containing protein [Proteinivorax hydrogeniformans]|uniref:HD-GYP domain-containing protein n=1 Tax=Proteinivorax hydrogeniformans TaxID=1826727 RepID=A0AAU8HVH8_9FIRM
MRFVPVNCVREGMKLGKTLLGENGQVLLSQGVVLKGYYIEKIKQIGYNGIYIEDEITDNIYVTGIISDSLKIKTVKNLKEFFSSAHRDSNSLEYENVQKSVEMIVDEILENKNLMVNMVDLKVFDNYTFYHSVNVAVLSIVIGVGLGLSRQKLYELGLAALLHDIGKVFIPKEVLNKGERLNKEELDIIKQHTQIGYDYLKKKYDVPVLAYLGALQHHERYDGEGYPNKLAKDKISLYGRIISVSDVYDALTSDRPYRPALSPSEGMEYILGGGGTMFDPEIVEIFSKKVAPYPAGTKVRLSNGLTAMVMQNFEDACIRPLVKVIEKDDSWELDLRDRQCYSITIEDIAKTG